MVEWIRKGEEMDVECDGSDLRELKPLPIGVFSALREQQGRDDD